MTEFEIDGTEFRFEKPSAMDQMHIARKIAPLLPALAPMVTNVLAAVAKEDDLNKEQQLKALVALAPLAQPFTDALASMKNEDAEFVFDKCLSVVQVHRGKDWFAYWNSKAQRASSEELNDPSLMLRVVLQVLKGSLGNFTRGFRTSVEEPVEAKI